MSSQFIFPNDFGYVPASLVPLGFILMWQTLTVSAARRRAGIAYPQPYAEAIEAKANPAAMRFNCAQRSHQNTLEVVPIVAISTLIFGLKYPVPAAAVCWLFVASRIIYTIGYNTGKPGGRLPGAVLGFLSMFILLGGSAYSAYLLWPSA